VETVDVAIVGAGPAGSTLAALLAARGLAVALIDRDTFPRDKLCGEFLSYDALPIADSLGIYLSAAPPIAHCRSDAPPENIKWVSSQVAGDKTAQTVTTRSIGFIPGIPCLAAVII